MKYKSYIILGIITAVIVSIGILGFLFFNIQEGQAIDMGGDSTEACFNDEDVIDPYDYCTYGFGFASCNNVNNCTTCGDYIDDSEPACSSNICVVTLPYIGHPVPCGLSYNEQDQPNLPVTCDVIDNNFDKAFKLNSPDGNTQFAITDGGHLLTLNGNSNIAVGYGEFIDTFFEEYPDNIFPIYNGDTLLAFFHSDDSGDDDYFYLRGSINEFQIPLIPPEPGSFVIKNSADMVVAFINPSGDLYLMGCVDDNGYNF